MTGNQPKRDNTADLLISPFFPLDKLNCLRDYTALASVSDMLTVEEMETSVQLRIVQVLPVSGYYYVSEEGQVHPV
jgi:hypothetical protein